MAERERDTKEESAVYADGDDRMNATTVTRSEDQNVISALPMALLKGLGAYRATLTSAAYCAE